MSAALAPLVRQYVSAGAAPEAHGDALNALLISTNRSREILPVVEALGPHLGGDAPEAERARATLLLAELLARLPALPLDARQAETLQEFFLARLRADLGSVREALMGLAALARLHSRALSHKALLRGLLAAMPPEALHTHVQRVRQAFFELLLVALAAVEAEGALDAELRVAAREHLLRAVDGEKDPRCLVHCFTLVRWVLRTQHAQLDATQLEAVFDAVACYFPITFNATPQQQLQEGMVSGDALRAELRECLTGHTGMAGLLVPLLLEKLEGARVEAKLDSLDTLAHAARVYARRGAFRDAMGPFLPQLWVALQPEVLHSGDAALRAAAEAALSALVAAVAPDEVGGFAVESSVAEARGWHPLLDGLLDEAAQEMLVPDSKLARAYARVLAVVAAASDNASELLLRSKVWRALVEKAATPGCLSSQRVALLEAARSWLAARPRPPPRLPAATVGEVIALFTRALAGAAAEAEAAAAALALAAASHPLLDEAELTRLVEWARRIRVAPASSSSSASEGGPALLAASPPRAARQQALALLVAVAGTRPELVLPALALGADTGAKLEELAALSAHLPLLAGVAAHLLALVRAGGAALAAALATLRDVVRPHAQSEAGREALRRELVLDAPPLVWEGVVRSAAAAAAASSAPAAAGGAPPDDATLAAASEVVAELTRVADAAQQAQLATRALAAFTEGRIEGVASFAPLRPDAPEWQWRLTPLLAAVVANLRREVAVARCPRALTDVAAATVAQGGARSAPMSECVASLLNKWPAGAELDALVRESVLQPLDAADARRLDAPWAHAGWALRALALRAHPQASALLQRLCAALGDGVRAAADAFALAVGEWPRAAFLAGSPVYRQRLLLEALPRLRALYTGRGADEQRGALALLALSHLLRAVPLPVVVSSLEQVLPLLLNALALEPGAGGGAVHFAALATLTRLLELRDESVLSAVSVHADRLVERLVAVATAPGVFAPAARVQALLCVEAVAALPFHRLFPLRHATLDALGRALDDPKRIVRAHAVRCRNTWFALKG